MPQINSLNIKNPPVINNISLQPIYLYNAVILDTETTGLRHYDEICEIAVIDAITAEPILNTLIKPIRKISEDAIKIHCITNQLVADAPAYPEIHEQLMTIFKEKEIIIYNADFDTRMIQQTASHYGLLTNNLHKPVSCAMKWYAKFYGQWDAYRADFKWQKLSNAARQQYLHTNLKAHRAQADCLITQQLIHAVNRKIILQNNYPSEQ